MKDPITTPGKTYAVTSPNGCTVTTEDGLTLAEVEAGKQGYFVAVGGKVLLSDDSAILTQLFKLAPQQRLALLGVLGGGVPAWFKALETELTALLDGSKFELAWLASKNTLVVHTDRISDELSDAVTSLLERVLPQNVEVESSNYLPMQRIMKKLPPLLDSALGGEGRHNLSYDESAASVAVEIAYPNLDDESAASVDAILAHELPPEVSMACGYGITRHLIDFLLHECTWRDSDNQALYKIFPKSRYTRAFELPYDMPEPEKLLANTSSGPPRWAHFSKTNIRRFPKAWTLANYTNLFEAFQNSPYLESVPEGATFEKVTSANHVFNASPKMQLHERCNFASLKEAPYFAIGTRFNKLSALVVLNTIPSYTGGSYPLTIGIHVDHQHDEEVLAAIANAEAKGWTLTVQWNGTPTAQASVTYGLRKPPIYARVSELENGERVLDWGHYVTDETGYEEFRSVEAAREYFGLPEEDLTNN